MGRSQKSCCHGSLCHVLESSLKAKDVRVALKRLAQNLQFFAVLWLWYLFIGWETNWMAFNIIKVDRHSGIACQNLQRCLIQIDPRRNGSSTNRESLGNGPNACSPFPNRVLTFYFLKKWKDTWYPFQDLWRSSHSAHSPLRISGNFAVKKTSCFAARTGQLGWAVATAILHQADQKCPRHLKIHGIIWHSPFPLILIMAYIIYPISSNRKPGSVFDLFIFWSRLGYVISGGWQPRKTTKNH